MFANSKGFFVFLFLSAAALVYLFASAPPPLAEANMEDSADISVKELLELCARENAAVRELYTKEIVSKGKDVGLKFDEKWHQAGVDAGPLPALFLRETAKSLERDPVPLGLFLGSDHPISKANLFQGQQANVFKHMRSNRQSKHFFVEDLQLYTAMFPDVAVAPACVSCHNEHSDTPKSDWKLGDVMGATTWSYPKAAVSLHEALQVLAALRRGFRAAYTAYIDKAKTFDSPPVVGEQWPTHGYFLPSPDEFMRQAELLTSPASMKRLMAAR